MNTKNAILVAMLVFILIILVRANEKKKVRKCACNAHT